MKKNCFILFCLFVFLNTNARTVSDTVANHERPSLVVGIVVDQMRWDYLYRYIDRYGEGGFKRLLKTGFSCDNTHINYVPTVTGAGHATIFTGAVPAIHGITANRWIERLTGASVYSTGDRTVQSVGSPPTEEGQMSPGNLLTTTVADELRLATNFRSTTVGVSLKANAAILSAGHTANAAFWFDPLAGKFISSTYYMERLPEWADNFNSLKIPEMLIAKGWETLYPVNTYKASSKDDVPWEGKFKGETSSSFPHRIEQLYKEQPAIIRQTPFGNTLTVEFAMALIEGYKLGKNSTTDFAAISFSSTDYVGHMFGINAIETEDTYIRLDRDLDRLLTWLDKKIGLKNCLVFLTADHGAPHAIQYNYANRLPAGLWNNNEVTGSLNKYLAEKTGFDSLVSSIQSYQVHFNNARVRSSQLDFAYLKSLVVSYLKSLEAVAFAVDNDYLEQATIPGIIKTKISNGYNFLRSGDVTIITRPGWFSGAMTGTNHGGWNPYDAHIPLVFMGWNVKPGKTNRLVSMTDIAPTIAALIKIQMPNGNVGNPITEITDR